MKDQPDRGLRVQILALLQIVAVVLFLLSLPACALCADDTPASIRVDGDSLSVDGLWGAYALARSGAVWGAVWERKVTVDVLPDVSVYCRTELYFAAFNSSFELVVKAPLLLYKDHCDAVPTFAIHGTEDGFAILYDTFEDGESHLQLARFDLGTRELTTEKEPVHSVPREEYSRSAILAWDDLGGPAVDFVDGELFFAVLNDKEDGFEVFGASPGESPAPVFDIAFPKVANGYHPPAFRGSFQLPMVMTWIEKPVAMAGGVAVAVSTDGERIDHHEVVVPLEADYDVLNVDFQILRDPDGISVFIHASNRIWEQRLSPEGGLLGEPRLLVTAEEDIFNFNAGSVSGACVLLYTLGNSDLQLYDCKTGKARPLGDGFAVTLSCGDDECAYSSGSRIEPLDFAAPVPTGATP